MILIALGSNVPGPWGSPAETLERAVREMAGKGMKVLARSSWIKTEPYGVTGQPAFVNGVVRVGTALSPGNLLQNLQAIEKAAGRERREKWGPRTLDLDIIAYNDVILAGGESSPDLTLPHNDLHNRPFVLEPILELEPAWRHPVSGKTAAQMLAEITNKGKND